MKRIHFFLAVFCGLLGSVQAETVLRIKNAVEVSSKDVRLGDLVQDASQLPKEWASRHVLSAPPAGKVSYQTLTAIAHGLSRYGDMKRVTLSGEPVIAISRKDRRVEKEEFKDPLLSYLKKTDPWKGNDLDVNVLSIPRNMRVPAGKTTYRISRIDRKTSKGYSVAYVSVVVDGEKAVELPVGIEIHFLTEVWVAAYNLERGHLFQEDDLRSEMHVVDATANYVSSKESLIGYELNRTLIAGSLLRRNAVSKPLCAKRGDWVAINALGSNLHITLRGKAMANGRLGDRIMCVNERSHRQILVELTSTGSGILVRL